jgi:hypothetical protein
MRFTGPLPCEERRSVSRIAQGRYLGLDGGAGEMRRRWKSPVAEPGAVQGCLGAVTAMTSGNNSSYRRFYRDGGRLAARRRWHRLDHGPMVGGAGGACEGCRRPRWWEALKGR